MSGPFGRNAGVPIQNRENRRHLQIHGSTAKQSNTEENRTGHFEYFQLPVFEHVGVDDHGAKGTTNTENEQSDPEGPVICGQTRRRVRAEVAPRCALLALEHRPPGVRVVLLLVLPRDLDQSPVEDAVVVGGVESRPAQALVLPPGPIRGCRLRSIQALELKRTN
jgi:hypothetical protein